MNIAPTLDLPFGTKDSLWFMMRRAYELLARAFNGNVEFGNPTSGPSNIRGVWNSVVMPGVANTDIIVIHNLGRPCVGYLICTKDRACDVYTSPTVNGSPNTQIILRGTVASAVLTMFLI